MSQRRVSCVPALPFWIDLIVLLLLCLHLRYQRLLQACYCPWVFGSTLIHGGHKRKGKNVSLKTVTDSRPPPPHERVHLRRQKSRLDVPCTASLCGSQNLRFVTLPPQPVSALRGDRWPLCRRLQTWKDDSEIVCALCGIFFIEQERFDLTRWQWRRDARKSPAAGCHTRGTERLYSRGG